MDKVFKILSYAFRGLAVLFFILHLCRVGSFMGLTFTMIGLYLMVNGVEDLRAGKKTAALVGVILGLFVLVYSFFRIYA